MNRDDIIRIAREAGFYANPEVEKFERFANLIEQEVIQQIKDKKNPAYSDIVSDGGMDPRN